MMTFQGLVTYLFSGQIPSPIAARSRTRGRGAPSCEGLEGRSLLTTGATGVGLGMLGMPGGFPMMGQPPSGSPPADVSHLAAKGKAGAHAFHGHAPGVAGAQAAPSAQLQADFATLQTDMKTLQSEISTSLTSALTADQAVLAKAFTPPTSTAGHDFAGRDRGMARPTTPPTDHARPTGDPSADLVKRLEAAGVSATQAQQVSTDLQNYQNALTTTDPTLQTKIKADQAAITKDGGAPMTPPTDPTATSTVSTSAASTATTTTAG